MMFHAIDPYPGHPWTSLLVTYSGLEFSIRSASHDAVVLHIPPDISCKAVQPHAVILVNYIGSFILFSHSGLLVYFPVQNSNAGFHNSIVAINGSDSQLHDYYMHNPAYSKVTCVSTKLTYTEKTKKTPHDPQRKCHQTPLSVILPDQIRTIQLSNHPAELHCATSSAFTSAEGRGTPQKISL